MLTINIAGPNRNEVALLNPEFITAVVLRVHEGNATVEITSSDTDLYFHDLEPEGAKDLFAMVERAMRA